MSVFVVCFCFSCRVRVWCVFFRVLFPVDVYCSWLFSVFGGCDFLNNFIFYLSVCLFVLYFK